MNKINIDELTNQLDSYFKDCDTEKFVVIGFDDKNNQVLFAELSELSKEQRAYFRQRRLFDYLKEYNCHSFVVSHNHPDGMPIPSSFDIKVTKEIDENSKRFGFVFIEHIICTRLKTQTLHWKILENM